MSSILTAPSANFFFQAIFGAGAGSRRAARLCRPTSLRLGNINRSGLPEDVRRPDLLAFGTECRPCAGRMVGQRLLLRRWLTLFLPRTRQLALVGTVVDHAIECRAVAAKAGTSDTRSSTLVTSVLLLKCRMAMMATFNSSGEIDERSEYSAHVGGAECIHLLAAAKIGRTAGRSRPKPRCQSLRLSSQHRLNRWSARTSAYSCLCR